MSGFLASSQEMYVAVIAVVSLPATLHDSQLAMSSQITYFVIEHLHKFL